VIGELAVGVVDLVELPDRLDEVELAFHAPGAHQLRGLAHHRGAEMLPGDHALGLDQLGIEFVQRQRRRQDRVLDIEQTVVPCRELAGFGQPQFGTGIRCRHSQMHDVGDAGGPFAHDGETLLVPGGIGDQVDRHLDADLARDFQRLGVGAHGDALAVQLQALGVDRFQAEEEIAETQLAPIGEDLAVLQQHVGAGLEIEALLDAALLHLGADREAVLGMDEGDVIDDEDIGLLDRLQLLADLLRRGAAIARP
jgi:hypothetical protein